MHRTHGALGLALLGTLIAAATPHAASRNVDDFEDRTLQAASGLFWIPICDDQFGGASRVTLEPSSEGAGGSRGALRLHGRTRKSEMSLVVAGAWVALGPRGGPVDLDGFDRLRFRVRGQGAGLEVGIRRGDTAGAQYNAMAPFTVTPEWSTVEIPFVDLKPQVPPNAEAPAWSASGCWYLGIATTPGRELAFDVQVDDVEVVGPGGAAAPSTDAPDGGAVYSDVVELAAPASLPELPWTVLAADEAGDGLHAGLPAARALSYAYEAASDRVWFRVELENDLPEDWFGMNVAVDADRDQANGSPWWGTNEGFRWDRLFTAYLFRVGSRWQGAFGVADSAGMARWETGSVARTGITLSADRAAREIRVAIPRKSLDDDLDMNLVATVGSALTFNDDVPGTGWATTTGARVRRW
jgi:hypothetical protein